MSINNNYINTGILLTNLGTPESPTPWAVRKYLKEFLSDRRVIEVPKIAWLPILYGFILPFRSRKSAKLYQQIWTPEGSPLRVIFQKQVQKCEKYFSAESSQKIKIFGAMRYGEPSLESVMADIQHQNINKLLLLPLYPQYSAATTATTFDKVAEILKTWRYQPALRVINEYYAHPDYISMMADSITQNKIYPETQKLLFSFHGLPKSFVEKGDPYQRQCEMTAKLIAEKLNLSDNQWQVSFQSRLGKAEWLRPYTDEVLKDFPGQNIKNLSVICPGFSADCLETLQEINLENREIFMRAGGKIYHYIPCLNDTDRHIEFLIKLIHQNIDNW